MNCTKQYKTVWGLTVQCARSAVLSVLLLVLLESPAHAQYDSRGPYYKDPEIGAIAAKKRQLDIDEKNIQNQQLGLGEFELKAQKIRKNMEAMSEGYTSAIPPSVQVSVAAMNKELGELERHIAVTKGFLASQALLLDSGKSQLKMMEEQYADQLSAMPSPPQVAKSPADAYRDKINQQNERIQAEIAQRQKQIADQNQAWMQGMQGPPNGSPGPSFAPMAAPAPAKPDRELQLCEMLEKKVAETNYDIAEINFLAAQGLPGAENIDVANERQTLDQWAFWVKRETERHLYKFRKAPGDYNNSEAYFRILMMVCTLQEDFKVCYSKDPKMKAGPVEVDFNDIAFFAKSQDLFVHGLTTGQHQGTCASLPVLYVAIGRRLGYPLKLVECKGHLFVRWEDARERFNIEGTNRGLNCFPDQEYMEWPYPISKEELDAGMYMKSLSPKRELAAFLELRSLCLRQNNREQYATVKRFADNLRKTEGVDIDKLNLLVRQNSRDGTLGSALLYQTLSATNSWRTPGDERGAPGKHTVFATDRFDSK